MTAKRALLCEVLCGFAPAIAGDSVSTRERWWRLSELIADDFVEYGVSGRVFGKLDVLEAADRLPDVETPLTDFAVEALSDSVSLVTHGVELNSMTSDKHCSAEFHLGPRQRSPAVPVPAGNARGGETATVTRLAHLTNKRINTTRKRLSY